MKVEYVPSGSKDCPLIRMFGDEPKAVQALASSIEDLIGDGKKIVRVTDLPGFEAINHTTLELRTADCDGGVQLTGNGHVWRLPPSSWRAVVDLLKPFTKRTPGMRFQWLYGRESRIGSSGEIAVIVSTDGAW
jgi:hypothetical protein